MDHVRAKEKHVVWCAAVALFIAMFCHPGMIRAESYKVLTPFLIDLEGWKAEEPEGMQMEQPGFRMINAVRSYSKDDGEVTAMILIGNTAASGFAGEIAKMSVDSDRGKMELKEIDGFQAYLLYDKKENSGNITIILCPGESGQAIFTLSFEGMDHEEGLKIAKSFDWKSMKKKIESMK